MILCLRAVQPEYENGMCVVLNKWDNILNGTENKLDNNMHALTFETDTNL